MGRTVWVGGGCAAVALLGTWAGCYQLSSDCTVLLTCGSGGAGGRGGAATSSASATAGTMVSSSTGTSMSTSSTGTSMSTSSSTGASSSSGGMVGAACTKGSDCLNGQCVDGFCCGSNACMTCTSCAIPGHEGTCTNIPAGVDDTAQPVNVCEMAATCDGNGMCTGANGLMHFGESCTMKPCFNGVCQGGLCKLKLMDPCVEDVTCGSGLCANHVCKACVTDTDCASGKCNAGVCALPAGAPCATGSDCLGTNNCGALGYCNLTGSDACTLTACPFHACPNQMCASCMSDSDCYMSTKCSMPQGQCMAPPGTFCTPGGLIVCVNGPCPPPDFLDFSKCK